MVESPIVCWLRQDLRLADHPSLAAAVKSGRPIVPLYILDETQSSWSPGGASRWWLNQSLTALAEQFEALGSRLVLRRGNPAEILEAITNELGSDVVHWTRCYEPHARKLDDDVKSVLDDANVASRRFAGNLLFEPEEIQTGGGTPYKVFTPYWRACCARGVTTRPLKPPKKLAVPHKWPHSDALESWNLHPTNPDWSEGLASFWSPGEAGAQENLKSFLSSALGGYSTDRDRPDRRGTSQLSPHLHFGEISPRQIWFATNHMAAKNGDEQGAQKFLAEIGWREFTHHLLFHWPTLPDQPFRAAFEHFPWAQNEAQLKSWQRGNTGYPVVDAGMRQLWQTGWMHNRVRMIVASFLIKHLMVPWQEGEAWFWDTLVDANLASNAAGWQWVAGSGADASPYFRIFNPISQGKKFDPDGAYVRKYVPELAELPNQYIHEPWMADPITLRAAGITLGGTYPKPIVDHAEARKRALEGYATVKESSAA